MVPSSWRFACRGPSSPGLPYLRRAPVYRPRTSASRPRRSLVSAELSTSRPRRRRDPSAEYPRSEALADAARFWTRGRRGPTRFVGADAAELRPPRLRFLFQALARVAQVGGGPARAPNPTRGPRRRFDPRPRTIRFLNFAEISTERSRTRRRRGVARRPAPLEGALRRAGRDALNASSSTHSALAARRRVAFPASVHATARAALEAKSASAIMPEKFAFSPKRSGRAPDAFGRAPRLSGRSLGCRRGRPRRARRAAYIRPACYYCRRR